MSLQSSVILLALSLCAFASQPKPDSSVTSHSKSQATKSQAGLKCCYGSKDSACGGSCDGSDDYCGASASQCTDCGGTLCNGTKALTKSAKSKSKEGSGNRCCYGRSPSDCSGSCDPADDYCGASESQCTECGGFFCNASSSPKKEKHVEELFAIRTKALTKSAKSKSKEESGDKCCYGRSPSDCSGSCDPADDYCGASESQCTECGGFFCNASSSPMKEKKSDGVQCCYGKGKSTCSGSCDGPNDYCGESESNCADCGGSVCPLAGKSKSSEKAKTKGDKSSSKDETRLIANIVEKDGSTSPTAAPKKASSGWGWTALTEDGVPTVDRISNTRRVLLAFSALAGLALFVSFVAKKMPRRSTDEAHYIMIA